MSEASQVTKNYFLENVDSDCHRRENPSALRFLQVLWPRLMIVICFIPHPQVLTPCVVGPGYVLSRSKSKLHVQLYEADAAKEGKDRTLQLYVIWHISFCSVFSNLIFKI